MAGFGIPKAFSSSGLAGDPIFFDGEVLSVPGSPVTIFTINVSAGVTINLTQLLGSAQFEGVFRVFSGVDLIATARTRAGKPDAYFPWFPPRPIGPGETIKVEFEQRASSPAVNIQAFLMGSQET